MTTRTASQARGELYHLLDEAADSHEPILITGKRNNAVLNREENWLSIQETLSLAPIPKMRESIVKGLKTSPRKCSSKLKW